MYIAMNHFSVAAGRGEEFEARWRDRKSYLDTVKGFRQFHLVRGKDEEDGSHNYASHVIWDSRELFVDWTHSEEFRKAHEERTTPEGLILAHPRFRGWQAIDL
jgi:heme-degrading monooxygenase HmoA